MVTVGYWIVTALWLNNLL